MARKYNPFRPDKIAGPGMFCGRAEELSTMDQCLLQAKNGNPQHFLIEGERGLGKSSLFLCEHLTAIGKVETMTKEKLDFVTLGISLNEKDDHYTVIKRIMAELKKEMSKRNAFKALGLAAFDMITRIEAGGFRYRQDAGKVDESELFGNLQADFVEVLSGIDGVADGMFLLVDEADKAPPDAGLA